MERSIEVFENILGQYSLQPAYVSKTGGSILRKGSSAGSRIGKGKRSSESLQPTALSKSTSLVDGMGALAVQVLAYYVFKMFFEQQMRERVRMTNIERQRTSKYRNMQQSFDHRRAEMEIRLQEAQLERELRWMEANPGKMPPSWGVQGGGPSIIGAFDAKQNERFDGSRIPTHEAESQTPVNLGIKDDVPLTKDGKPDKRYTKKGE